MHYSKFCFPLALALALNTTFAAASKEERVQIWQYQNEEPLAESSLDPTVHSVRWREGDVEIIFTQAAPCGAWMPMNPAWNVEKFSVVLNFAWYPRFPNTPAPTVLCKKFVRAWVFRVPQGQYKVSFAESVPRFHQHEGKVTSVPGPVKPNPSLKRSANGRPPGPGLGYAVHFPRPGPGVLPSSPA